MIAATALAHTVHRILRLAHAPSRLRAVPLVNELCEVMGTPDPIVMLEAVIASAFGNSPMEQRLRDIIVEHDLHRGGSRTSAAQRFNVSLRHYHRLRAHAVCLISLRIQDILEGASEARADMLEPLAEAIARFDPEKANEAYALLERTRLPDDDDRALIEARTAMSQLHAGAGRVAVRTTLMFAKEALRAPAARASASARFEIASVEFELAQRESDARAMSDALRSMRAPGSVRRDLELRRYFAVADFLLRTGDWDEAHKVYEEIVACALATRDAASLAMCAAYRAQLCVLTGRYDDAEVASSAAAIALEHRTSDAFRVAILQARICTARGSAWDGRELYRRIPPNTYERASIGMLSARFALCRGCVDEAQALAEASLETCARQKFAGLLAEAHSTLGAVEDAKGNAASGQEHYAFALERIAVTADWLIASAAFAGPGMPRRKFGPLNSAQPLVDASCLRLREMLGVRKDHIDWDSAGGALRTAFDAALEDATAPRCVLDSIALVQLLGTQRDLVRNSLRLVVRSILPFEERNAFERRLFEFLEIF